jgi:UDP-N-acetylmuramoylalanine--D-glutamate ligase
MDYDVVMGLEPNRVVVVGAGKTGLAVAKFCAERNAHVTLTDKREIPVEEIRGVEWELGGHRAETFLAADLIVVSPGVPKLPELEAARKKGIPITGEIELAAKFIQAPIVAVTGTNGKSTVTALAGEIAKQTGKPTFVGGNLGTPLITAVGTPAASLKGIVVVELSSFQLETCEQFHPRAAALTNLTPDHLDRYASLDDYGRAKLRIAQRMAGTDVLVVNADDPWIVDAVRPLESHMNVAWFSTRKRERMRAFLDGNDLVQSLEGGDFRVPFGEMNLIGRHNCANALAAILLMSESGLAGFPPVSAGLKSFQPLPHRMQLVGEKRGVRFYDDSKATNVDSVVAGIDGFPVRFVLIAGGRDKGGSYAPMVAALKSNPCIEVVLIGEAADKIDAAIAGAVPTSRARTLEDAVKRGAERTQSGDAVVLSPACSSYDMFQNYEHRGRAFRAAVEAL